MTQMTWILRYASSEINLIIGEFSRELNGSAKYCLLIDKQLKRWYAKGNIYVEVVNLNAAEYHNRDALNKALDQYLDAMFQFVSECLDERSIREALSLLSGGDLREKMEVKDIAKLIQENWSTCFKKEFKIVDRDYIRYYDAQSVTSLIIEGRNQASHQRLKELDPEFTRTQLFFIAEVLGKINRPDAQREVEAIRDNLFEDTTEQEERFTTISNQLALTEAERDDYKERLEAALKQLDEVNERPSITSERAPDQMQAFAIKAAELRNAHLRPGATVKSWKEIGDEIGISRPNRYILRASDEYRDAIIKAVKEAGERDFRDVEIPRNPKRQFGYLGDQALIEEVIADTFQE